MARTRKVTTETIQDSIPSYSSLYVFGQVIDRTRTNFNTRNNSTTEIITFRITAVDDTLRRVHANSVL